MYSDLILLHLVLIGLMFSQKHYFNTQRQVNNTVKLWFKKEDLSISNIYKIAESYGWEVNITFKLKPQGKITGA